MYNGRQRSKSVKGVTVPKLAEKAVYCSNLFCKEVIFFQITFCLNTHRLTDKRTIHPLNRWVLQLFRLKDTLGCGFLSNLARLSAEEYTIIRFVMPKLKGSRILEYCYASCYMVMILTLFTWTVFHWNRLVAFTKPILEGGTNLDNRRESIRF